MKATLSAILASRLKLFSAPNAILYSTLVLLFPFAREPTETKVVGKVKIQPSLIIKLLSTLKRA